MRCFDATLHVRKSFLLILFLAGALVTARGQQQPAQPIPPNPTQAPSSSDENDNDPVARRALAQQVQRRNSLRQQDIQKDTDKLLELAQQLKAEVDKSDKNQMSLPVIKKAEEIEKLAKSVKEKMKGN